MSQEEGTRGAERWARFRFGVVAPLYASPPAPGELRKELARLSGKTWVHPVHGEPFAPSARTIETWYYQGRRQADPVAALRRKRRSDSGRQPSVTGGVAAAVRAQYQKHPGWSVQLHHDNLAVLVEEDPTLGTCPSYPSLRRFMSSAGMVKRRRPRRPTPGQVQAEERLESREVRSYEAEFVNGLWHLDFHACSRPVLTPQGTWEIPKALGILDDRSRWCPHLQWYLGETTSDLVHGFRQAVLKGDLPRELMSDNGSAMVSAEFTQGLLRLGVHHTTTLPYSPYQNGKQETFWGQVEGRLLAMLEGQKDLTLRTLNEATQAWVELGYNRKEHSETGQPPLERYLQGPSVARRCPPTEALDLTFLGEWSRSQRQSDGTVSIEGRRFEVPSRFRHLRRVAVRYARWDLRCVLLVDQHTGVVLSPLYPVDPVKNASGRRRPLIPTEPAAEPTEPTGDEIAPYLRRLMSDYAATGLPPAYLPKIDREDNP
ncbi:MAG: transposase family protein [Acidobacteria bacterium]|nr:transposase family protein [Acidobacteriota bacterium]